MILKNVVHLKLCGFEFGGECTEKKDRNKIKRAKERHREIEEIDRRRVREPQIDRER